MTVLLKQVMFYLHQPTRRFSPLLRKQLKGFHTTAFCRQVDHERNAQLPAKTIDLKKSNSSQDDTSDTGRCGFIKDFVPFRLPRIRTKPEPQITLDGMYYVDVIQSYMLYYFCSLSPWHLMSDSCHLTIMYACREFLTIIE